MVAVPWAVQTGDLEAVKSNITRENINETDANGRTALHIASDYGHANIVQYLLDAGANIEATDKFGIRPLLAAVWEGHVECGAQRDLVAPDGTALIDCTEEEPIREMLRK